MDNPRPKKERKKKESKKDLKKEKPEPKARKPRKRVLSQRERQALKPSDIRLIAYEGGRGAFGQQAIVASGEPTPPIKAYVAPTIQPTPVVAPTPVVQPLPNLSSFTVASLRDLAREKGVRIPSRALKADIINLLQPVVQPITTQPVVQSTTTQPTVQATLTARPQLTSAREIKEALPVEIISAEGKKQPKPTEVEPKPKEEEPKKELKQDRGEFAREMIRRLNEFQARNKAGDLKGVLKGASQAQEKKSEDLEKTISARQSKREETEEEKKLREEPAQEMSILLELENKRKEDMLKAEAERRQRERDESLEKRLLQQKMDLERQARLYAEEAVSSQINALRDPTLQVVEQKLAEDRDRFERERQELQRRSDQQQAELQQLLQSQKELREQQAKSSSEEAFDNLQNQLELLQQQILILEEDLQKEARQRQDIEGNIEENIEKFQKIEDYLVKERARRQKELQDVQTRNQDEIKSLESQIESFRTTSTFTDERRQEIETSVLSRLDERTRPLTVAQQAFSARLNTLNNDITEARRRAEEANLMATQASEGVKRLQTGPRSIEAFFGRKQEQPGSSSAPPPEVDEVERERMRQQAEMMRRVPAGQREGGQFVERIKPELSPEDLQKLDQFGSYSSDALLQKTYRELTGKKKLPTPTLMKTEIVNIVKARGELPEVIKKWQRS